MEVNMDKALHFESLIGYSDYSVESLIIKSTAHGIYFLSEWECQVYRELIISHFSKK